MSRARASTSTSRLEPIPLGLQWSPGYYRLIDARHVRVVLFSPLTSLSERRVITVWTATDIALAVILPWVGLRRNFPAL